MLPSPSPVPLADIAGVLGGGTCVAVNGGFYDGAGAMGWVVHAGEVAAPSRPGGGSGVLLVDGAGPRIVHSDATGGRPREALQSIDRLVDGGRSLVGPKARPESDARSAVALRGDGTVVLAVVFAEEAVAREQPGRVELGRASSSSGLSLAAWAELLARPVADGGLGAATALNLDGGYSTSMAIHAVGVDLEVIAYAATINAVRACAREGSANASSVMGQELSAPADLPADRMTIQSTIENAPRAATTPAGIPASKQASSSHGIP